MSRERYLAENRILRNPVGTSRRLGNGEHAEHVDFLDRRTILRTLVIVIHLVAARYMRVFLVFRRLEQNAEIKILFSHMYMIMKSDLPRQRRQGDLVSTESNPMNGPRCSPRNNN